MIALATNVQWGSSPKIYVSFYYEKVRDGANMKYRTQTVINPITGASTFGYYINQELSINGSEREDTQLKGNSPSQWGSAITYTSPWYTVANKISGTTPVSFTLYTNSGRSSLSVSYSMAIDPANPVITSFSVSKDTETSVKFNFTTDSKCDWAWYSKDNGSNWYDLPANNIVTGLTANTTYNFKLKVRREDNKLETVSSAFSQTTYNYPYCTTMPDFIIGNVLSLGFYNPLGRSITATILGDDGSTIGEWSGTGTAAVGFNDSSSKAQQYQSIPNKKSATYQVQVVYGSSTITKTGGTYSINEAECVPTLFSISYYDTNSNTLGITGNNQQIIRNQSIVRYYAYGLAAKNSATIASCSVNVNGNSYNLTLGSIGNIITAAGGNAIIDSAINLPVTFTLTDSRGITKTREIEIQMLDWVLPTAIINVQRHNNFYSETDINVDALYSSIDNKNTITIQYCYKKTTESTYSQYYSLQDNVTSTDTFDNLYEWDIKFKITDLFGTTYYNIVLAKGMPIMFIDRRKNALGINCFPQDEKSFEINGSENTRYCGKATASTISVSTISNFQTVDFDTYDLKSTKTIEANYGNLKILKAGTYKITFNVRWSDMASGTTNNCYTGISVNGVTGDDVSKGVFQPNMKRLTVNASFILDLAVNDTIQIQVLTDVATSIKDIIFFVEALNVEVD